MSQPHCFVEFFRIRPVDFEGGYREVGAAKDAGWRGDRPSILRIESAAASARWETETTVLVSGFC
jgi:hypothetical protein